ncbi:MAG: hypothetical protein WDN24_12040 [Sphingomonas sp.]
MQYGNHNGLHISRIVSPENVGLVRVSQGAGAIGTAIDQQSRRHDRDLLDRPPKTAWPARPAAPMAATRRSAASSA